MPIRRRRLVVDLSAAGCRRYAGRLGRIRRTVYCGPIDCGGLRGDHHRAASRSGWLRRRAAVTHGATDDFSYNIASDRCTSTTCRRRLNIAGHRPSAADLPYQGRDFRLTDVFGKTVHRRVNICPTKSPFSTPRRPTRTVRAAYADWLEKRGHARAGSSGAGEPADGGRRFVATCWRNASGRC